MNKLKLRHLLVEERGHYCEFPGCGNVASQLHHGIIGDKKRLKDVLFCKENLFLACYACNVGRIGDNMAYHSYFWSVNCDRYGAAVMGAWLDRVNDGLIVKYKFAAFSPPAGCYKE